MEASVRTCFLFVCDLFVCQCSDFVRFSCFRFPSSQVDEIVRGNDLPVSIVIIGIGKANFSKMEFLDADDVPLRSTWGQVAAR